MDGEIGWITAREALARLGVRPQTLYAYVSRGRVQARPHPADPRRSLYSEPDVDRVAASSRVVRRPAAVAAQAMAWGEPVLPSAISTVHAGRLLYRGVDAVDLSAEASLEEAAALLWDGDPGPNWAAHPQEAPQATAGGLAAAFAMLAQHAAAGRPLAAPVGTRQLGEAAALVGRLVAALCGVAPRTGEPLHILLARAWKAPEAADVLRRALVLLADHELNVSTFAVRVTASSGAPLAGCILAGLCALSGPRHGRAGLELADIVALADDRAILAALERRRARDEPIPGFGHPLYAGADLRATALMEAFEPDPAHARLRRLVEKKFGVAPNIDFALSAMTAQRRLPAQAPLLIFAAARSVGWIAHAFEQIQAGGLIRPRARYVGPAPAGLGRGAA